MKHSDQNGPILVQNHHLERRVLNNLVFTQNSQRFILAPVHFLDATFRYGDLNAGNAGDEMFQRYAALV